MSSPATIEEFRSAAKVCQILAAQVLLRMAATQASEHCSKITLQTAFGESLGRVYDVMLDNPDASLTLREFNAIELASRACANPCSDVEEKPEKSVIRIKPVPANLPRLAEFTDFSM